MFFANWFKNSALKYNWWHFGIIFILSVIAELYCAFSWDIHYFGVDAFIILFSFYYLICPDLSRRLNAYSETYALSGAIFMLAILALLSSIYSINNTTGYENQFRGYSTCVFGEEGTSLLMALIFINYVISVNNKSKHDGGRDTIIINNDLVFIVRLLIVFAVFLNIIKFNNYLTDYNYIRYDILTMSEGTQF